MHAYACAPIYVTTMRSPEIVLGQFPRVRASHRPLSNLCFPNFYIYSSAHIYIYICLFLLVPSSSLYPHPPKLRHMKMSPLASLYLYI